MLLPNIQSTSDQQLMCAIMFFDYHFYMEGERSLVSSILGHIHLLWGLIPPKAPWMVDQLD